MCLGVSLVFHVLASSSPFAIPPSREPRSIAHHGMYCEEKSEECEDRARGVGLALPPVAASPICKGSTPGHELRQTIA